MSVYVVYIHINPHMGLFYPINTNLPEDNSPTDDCEATICLLYLLGTLRLAVGLPLFDQAEWSILKVIS